MCSVGGAYMPIEIVHPPEMITKMVNDAQPKAILTKNRYTHKLQQQMQQQLPVLCMDGARCVIV